MVRLRGMAEVARIGKARFVPATMGAVSVMVHMPGSPASKRLVAGAPSYPGYGAGSELGKVPN